MGFFGVWITLIIVVIVFLVLREFWCWYWKFSEMVRLLGEINSKMDVLVGVTDEGNRLLEQATGDAQDE